MKVINIPVLGSFVKYSDYENQSKILQVVSNNNEELYKREQELKSSLLHKEACNSELQTKNTKLYEDNTKLHLRLKQAKKEINLFWLWLVGFFLVNIAINFIN